MDARTRVQERLKHIRPCRHHVPGLDWHPYPHGRHCHCNCLGQQNDREQRYAQIHVSTLTPTETIPSIRRDISTQEKATRVRNQSASGVRAPKSGRRVYDAREDARWARSQVVSVHETEQPARPRQLYQRHQPDTTAAAESPFMPEAQSTPIVEEAAPKITVTQHPPDSPIKHSQATLPSPQASGFQMQEDNHLFQRADTSLKWQESMLHTSDLPAAKDETTGFSAANQSFRLSQHQLKPNLRTSQIFAPSAPPLPQKSPEDLMEERIQSLNLRAISLEYEFRLAQIRAEVKRIRRKHCVC